MLTVVGDPLYRPFQEPLDSALALAGAPHTAHDDWLLLQEVQREIVAGQIEAKTDNLERALNVPGAGAVAEGLGDLLEKLNEPGARPPPRKPRRPWQEKPLPSIGFASD